MKWNGQLQDPVALPSGRNPRAQWTGSSEAPREVLDGCGET